MARAVLVALAAALLLARVAALSQVAQPNPPTWPSTVRVFTPADTDIEAVVNAAYAVNGGQTPPNNGQFSSARYAFLFEPGTYNVDVPVGYYTQVLGLGAQPTDVSFTGAKGVYCEEGDKYFAGGALDTFWRSGENFETNPTYKWPTTTGMLWAVSQASPLRRVSVNADLSLYQYEPPYGAAGYSSGGYMSDSKVTGTVTSGSQQQFFVRNSQVGKWTGANWNMVFVGVQGAPPSHCGRTGGLPFTTVGQTPLVAEKPFISVSASGQYSLNVPAVKQNSAGVDWSTPLATSIPFESVYVANNVTDTAASMNAALASGLHLVITPGVYTLMEPLYVNHTGQVVLGLGLATLVPGNGNAVIQVGNVDGVRIAGPMILQAGTMPTKVLLQWGDGTYAGSASQPGGVYDVFARVGGPDTVPVQAEVMMRIESGNVFTDNMWLWRADHTVSGIVKNSDNPVDHGLVVTGDNVIAYGLAVEHTLQDLVQWTGEKGSTYFFQSEMPYDVTQQNWGDMGFVAYRVNSTVQQHNAWGVGVYTFFRDYNVTVQTGISVPTGLVPSFVAPLGVYLSGKGTMLHVIDQQGGETSWRAPSSNVQYVC